MSDPATAGVLVTGIVGAYKAYTEYKAAVVKTQAEQKPPPVKSEEAIKGEQVAQIVEGMVQQHGTKDEQMDLLSFERNPQRYQDVLVTVLKDIAIREPTVASQLQTLAQQANIQTSGLQGSVNISGQGKVYGPAAGVNSGEMSGTYNFGRDNDEEQ